MWASDAHRELLRYSLAHLKWCSGHRKCRGQEMSDLDHCEEAQAQGARHQHGWPPNFSVFSPYTEVKILNMSLSLWSIPCSSLIWSSWPPAGRCDTSERVSLGNRIILFPGDVKNQVKLFWQSLNALWLRFKAHQGHFLPCDSFKVAFEFECHSCALYLNSKVNNFWLS